MKSKDSVASNLETIPQFLNRVVAKLKKFSVEDNEIYNIRLSLEEALVNAVKHGNNSNPNLSVEVTTKLNNNTLTIEVKDQGKGFDYNNLEDPTSDVNLKKLSGRGIFLIKNLMDKVEFLDGGRRIKMIKFLKSEGEVGMNVKEERVDDIFICGLSGEINITTSLDLRKAFDTIVKNNEKKVIVDLSQVSYIDSSGLATLIEMFQRLKKIGGSLHFSNMQDKVRNIFEVTKLSKLFSIFPSRKEAIEAFSK